MSPKTRSILGWVLTGLLSAFLLFSAVNKFMDKPETAQMTAALGLTSDSIHIIGMVEILSVLLFLIPRTGVLGTLMLSAYLGGAIATHVEHPVAGPPTAAMITMAILWITATIRFPELTARLTGRVAGR